MTAGGGVVEVVMTGHQRVQSIRIDPEVVDPEDVEMLQDLIVAAVNEAIERSQGLAAEQMAALTGGLGLGDLGGILD
jgi:DNA-binding YbaB/EbfC family protein